MLKINDVSRETFICWTFFGLFKGIPNEIETFIINLIFDSLTHNHYFFHQTYLIYNYVDILL